MAQTQSSPNLKLSKVGLKYRLRSEREATIKGRVLETLTLRQTVLTDFWAVRNVSFEIGPGEIVAILGGNGAGKSTLLRIMAGVIPPTEGSVESSGSITPLLELGGAFNPELTGRANCYLAGALQRMNQKQLEQEIIPKVQEFAELGQFFDVPMKYYSSGMAARLGFAFATQMNPDILLIDEVLAVGDENFQKKSYFRMLNLIQKGRMVVLVTHAMALVEQLCTRAILIDGHGVAADGKPAAAIAEYRKRSARS